MRRSNAVVCGALSVLLVACAPGKTPQNVVTPTQAPDGPPVSSAPKTMRESMAQFKTLPEAVEAMRPMMSDETNDMSSGAIALAS